MNLKTATKKQKVIRDIILIAEMYRRTGDFKNAVKYYDVVIKSPKKSPWIEDMVMEQKKLAVKKDDNNKI